VTHRLKLPADHGLLPNLLLCVPRAGGGTDMFGLTREERGLVGWWCEARRMSAPADILTS